MIAIAQKTTAYIRRDLFKKMEVLPFCNVIFKSNTYFNWTNNNTYKAYYNKIISEIYSTFFVNRQKELGTMNGFIEEMVSGQKAVLLFSQEKHVIDEFSKINKRLTKSAIIADGISGVMGPINNFINNLKLIGANQICSYIKDLKI